MAETYRFAIYDKGQKELLENLAYGFDAFAGHIVERVQAHAPFGTGVHPPRSKKKPPLIFHYRDTIHATTYLGGERISGREVRTPGFNPRSYAIASVIYTTATPWGHIYEVTGAGPHAIPGTIGAGGHPGVARRPHFQPGLFEAATSAGVMIRGRARRPG